MMWFFVLFILGTALAEDFVFDGDMRFPHMPIPTGTRHHAALRDETLLWKKTKWENKWAIPYAFDSTMVDIPGSSHVNTMTPSQEIFVRDVMASMNIKLRSVVFVERTTEEFYITIGKYTDGCWSYVGDVTQFIAAQPVNFGNGCFTSGVVEHELMHVLGFGHEHARSDRDDYVTIKWENIDQQYENNFEVLDNQRTLGVDYDYTSVMHYSQYTFAKAGGLRSIETTDPAYQEIIGTVEEMSDADVLEIELLYRCDSGPRDHQNFCSPDCPCYNLEGYCNDHLDCVEPLVCSDPGDDNQVVGNPPKVCLHTFIAGVTRGPTTSPTGTPTVSPTGAPTRAPTYTGQTYAPTSNLQDIDTEAPTGAPTSSPSRSPTGAPTTSTPSVTPTVTPTGSPTGSQEETRLSTAAIAGIAAGVSVGALAGVGMGVLFLI